MDLEIIQTAFRAEMWGRIPGVPARAQTADESKMSCAQAGRSEIQTQKNVVAPH